MTWGAYWLFYKCPDCGKKYKYTLEMLDNPKFGFCPDCDKLGDLVCETRDRPADFMDYEDIDDI